MNSTPNFGPGDWGLAVIAASYHFASTMGEKAQFLSQGTKTMNQLITNRPTIIPDCPIEYGALVTFPLVGPRTKASPANQIGRYVCPGTSGTNSSIVVPHSSRGSFRLMVRAGVRPIMLPSQLQKANATPTVAITPDADRVLEITGLADPISIYTAEGFPDPGEQGVKIPIQDLMARPNRLESTVPDTLQYLISAEQELEDLLPRRITRSVDTLIILPPTESSSIVDPSPPTVEIPTSEPPQPIQPVPTPMVRQPFRLIPPTTTLDIADHVAEYKHLVSTTLFKTAASSPPIARNWEDLRQHAGLDEEDQKELEL